jgi:hypothetical protein
MNRTEIGLEPHDDHVVTGIGGPVDYAPAED